MRIQRSLVAVAVLLTACSGGSGGSVTAVAPASLLQQRAAHRAARAADAASTSIAVTVHPGTILGTIHRDVLGVNNSISRTSLAMLQTLGTSAYPAMGITAGRWPGGRLANAWGWQDYQSGTMTQTCAALGYGPYPPAAYDNADFDAYMTAVAIPNNLSVDLTTNYDDGPWTAGSSSSACNVPGSPAYAAAWVQYANVTKGYGVKWWEVSNENYITSKTDQHTVANGWPSGPNSPITYASAEPAFYAAMKAVDPTISVGCPIGGTDQYAVSKGWDLYVMQHATCDFFEYHYYPLTPALATDAAVLNEPIYGSTSGHTFAAGIANVRTNLETAGLCSAPCANYPIDVGEWNTDGSPYTGQTMTIVQGLFAAEVLGEMFNASIEHATEWEASSCALAATTGVPSGNYGWQPDVSDNGLVTYAMPDASGNSKCAPGAIKESYPFGTILPSGRAFQLYSQSGFATEGAAALGVDQPSQTLRSYASSNSSQYIVMLLNLDESDSLNVSLSIDGLPGSTGYSTIQYSKALYDQSSGNGCYCAPAKASQGVWLSPIALSLPPWSMTALSINKLANIRLDKTASSKRKP